MATASSKSGLDMDFILWNQVPKLQVEDFITWKELGDDQSWPHVLFSLCNTVK